MSSAHMHSWLASASFRLLSLCMCCLVCWMAMLLPVAAISDSKLGMWQVAS
jgi:hypothetical protein